MSEKFWTLAFLAFLVRHNARLKIFSISSMKFTARRRIYALARFGESLWGPNHTLPLQQLMSEIDIWYYQRSKCGFENCSLVALVHLITWPVWRWNWNFFTGYSREKKIITSAHGIPIIFHKDIVLVTSNGLKKFVSTHNAIRCTG